MFRPSEAVAIGTAMICRAAVRMGRLDPASRNAVLDLLRQYELPINCEYTAEQLFEILLLDKKIASGKLNLVVPKSIGWCEIVPVGKSELRNWLEASYE